MRPLCGLSQLFPRNAWRAKAKPNSGDSAARRDSPEIGKAWVEVQLPRQVLQTEGIEAKRRIAFPINS